MDREAEVAFERLLDARATRAYGLDTEGRPVERPLQALVDYVERQFALTGEPAFKE